MIPPNLRNLIESIQDAIANVLGIANNAHNEANHAHDEAIAANNRAEFVMGLANNANAKANDAYNLASAAAQIGTWVQNLLNLNRANAIVGANNPTENNPFATVADIPAPLPAIFTGEVLDAIEQSNSPQASNPFATIADIPDPGGYDPGYKEYIALVRQSGTNAPTATVLKNTLDEPVVYNYVTVGTYTVTCASITANKATVNGQYPFLDGGGYSNIHTIWQYLAGSMTKHCYLTLNVNENPVFGIRTKIDDQLIDNILGSYPALIIIRVYP